MNEIKKLMIFKDKKKKSHTPESSSITLVTMAKILIPLSHLRVDANKNKEVVAVAANHYHSSQAT